jgi:hypothetical protein
MWGARRLLPLFESELVRECTRFFSSEAAANGTHSTLENKHANRVM